jgi:ABC-type cobalt transport system substrate-binding protein
MMISMKKTIKILLAVALIALAILVTANLPYAQAPTTTSSTSSCGLVTAQLQTQIQSLEPWYCPINQQIYGEWSSVGLPLALIATMLSFVIASLIFMIGVAFNNATLKNFGIGEFYESIATAIIVGAFLYICAVIFGIIPAIAVGTINPFATAFNLISQTIGTAQQMYTSLFRVYLAKSFEVSPTVNLDIGGAVSKFASGIISTITQQFFNIYTIPITIYFLDPALAISRFLADGISILYAEYYLMVFFATAAVPAFLVPGIILRSIFPTRSIGGIMIAIAIGFYIVMPTLFAVAYYFTSPSVTQNMRIASIQMTRFGSGESTNLSPANPLVLQLGNVQSALDGFWLLILFYPTLIISITYLSVQELSRFLGAPTKTMGSVRRFI